MYDKVIFVCKENVSLSPMAEWIMKSILMDKSKKICSRGLVVLFPEPYNKKVLDLLMLHGIPCEEKVSEEFDPAEVDERTIIITMNFTEKVKLVEDFGLEQVYTLTEFVDEEDDVTDPYGGDEEAYEACYVEMKALLYKAKRKLNWR